MDAPKSRTGQPLHAHDIPRASKKIVCRRDLSRFRVMRANQAALKYQAPTGNADPEDHGLERFLTATRRLNFLLPPRPYRSFPLLELT